MKNPDYRFRRAGKFHRMSFRFLTHQRAVNTRQLAKFIVTTQEGAFGMAKTMKDRKMINSLYNSLKDYIESKTDAFVKMFHFGRFFRKSDSFTHHFFSLLLLMNASTKYILKRKCSSNFSYFFF